MALDLDNLTVTGTTYLACRFEAGVITRGNGQINLWDDGGGDGPNDQSAGTILDGSMTMTGLANVTSLRRVGRWNDQERGRWILNSQADDTGMGDVFSGTTNMCTLFMEGTGGAVSSFTVGQRRSGGGNWVDWWRETGQLTDAEWAILNAVAAGDECILVLHTGTATYTVPTVVNTGDAETVAYHFEAAEATGSSMAVVRTGTADTVDFDFSAAQADGHVEVTGTASAVDFEFTVSEADGTATAITVNTGTANAVDFAFSAAEADGSVTAHIGTADTIDWEFAASSPTGVVGSAAAANRIDFEFTASEADGSVTHHVGTANAVGFAFEAAEALALVDQVGTAEPVRFSIEASQARQRVTRSGTAEPVAFHLEASEPTGTTLIVTVWGQARDALVAALRSVDRLTTVLVAPPKSGAAFRSGVTAYIAPPARSTERRAGPTTKKIYPLKITVVTPMGTSVEKATLAVDNAVEGIDAELERHVTLGGFATSVGALKWTEAAAEEYPPGSGKWNVGMVGTAEVVIISTVDRSA